MSKFVWIFVAIIAAAGVIVFLRNKPSSPELRIENISFTWNVETKTLESDDPDIFIRVFGQSMAEPYTESVLYIGSRKIGFSTALPAYKTDDGRRIWVVKAIGIHVSRGGSKGTIYAHTTKFADREEQDRVVALISAALKNFVNKRHEDKTANSIVKFDDQLQQKLKTGKLIILGG